MKGVSSIIIAVLLLMIAVSLASIGYLTLNNAYNNMKSSGNGLVSMTATSQLGEMKILNITSGTETAVFLQNIGKVNLTNFSAYVNDTLISIDPATPSGGAIAPGEIKNVNITSSVPSGSIVKISSYQGAEVMLQVA